MSQTIFMSNLDTSLHDIVTWASNRELPGNETARPREQQQLPQQQLQQQQSTTATVTVNINTSTNSNNNNNSQQQRQQEQLEARRVYCCITSFLPCFVTCTCLMAGVVCLIMYFETEFGKQKNILIAALMLLIGGG